VSDSLGVEYRALHSLEEAKSFADGVVILEGDDGGQIYIVCPASLIQCSQEALNQLLRDMDAIAWPGNDEDSARVFYERQPTGAGIAGGMGGAVVEESVWIHREFQQLGLDTAIREVVTGKRLRIRDDT
jgi:hypothetical protein